MRFWPWPSRKSDEVSTMSSGPMSVLREWMKLRSTKSGKRVTVDTALQVTTVFAAVRAIANGVAQVPLKVFQESEDGSVKHPARKHPSYRMLYRKPNAWQTSFEYRQTLMLHLLLAGQHFSFKNVVRGRVVELIPFEPGMVTVLVMDDGSMRYRVTFPGGQVQEFGPEVIWHVRGLSWDSRKGLAAVKLAREAIGLALATEERHSNMHRNGIMPAGVYSVDGTLSAKQFEDLREFLRLNYTGVNDGLPMLLDRNAKWQQIAQTGVDNQHLETRRFQVEEICRGIGCMPIMVYQADKTASYASTEQMYLAHIVHDLAPWYECLEQSMDTNVLNEQDEREGYYTKFNVQALLRGALKDTAEYLYRLVSIGVMTPNEARAKLELNPLPNGDKPLTPINMRLGFQDQEAAAQTGA